MANLTEVKARLTEKLAGLGRTDHKAALQVERSAEIMDTVMDASARDLAVHYVDQEARTGAAIRAALQRITDGTYGLCVDCDEPISPKRLQAVPQAARCIGCQEEEDERSRVRPSRLGQDFLMTA